MSIYPRQGQIRRLGTCADGATNNVEGTDSRTGHGRADLIDSTARLADGGMSFGGQ